MYATGPQATRRQRESVGSFPKKMKNFDYTKFCMNIYRAVFLGLVA
jgi:hypothetical protein